MRTSIHLITESVLLAVAMTFAAAEVNASDSKIYPATMCRIHGSQRHGLILQGSNYGPNALWSHTIEDSVSNLHFTKNGTLVNQSTTHSLKVVCPIVRDDTLNTDGLEQVIVLARNSQGNYPDLYPMWCELRSVGISFGSGWDPDESLGVTRIYMEYYGHDAGFFPYEFTSGDSDSIETIYEYDPEDAFTATQTSGYLLYCLIPPREAGETRSGISFYVVSE